MTAFHFVDSDTPATHWLLLDREVRTCYAGMALAVQRTLRTRNPAPDAAAWSWPPAEEPLPALTEEDWKALVDSFRDVQVTVTPEEIHQRLTEHARVLDTMRAWLDAPAG
jgi:hypothetical protein